MVQQGFAINVPGKDRFAGDEAKARIEHSGLWRGCFAAPQSFRRWDRDAVLLGASCRDDKRAETVELLFPARTTMPPGCPIKGKFARRARLTGNVGVYHLQGCRSYAGNTKPDRWFCSEDDAKAAASAAPIIAGPRRQLTSAGRPAGNRYQVPATSIIGGRKRY